MPSPLISVIIPTCKRPELLGRAIDSVLMQDYESVEVVVADDNKPGSSEWEATQSVLERYGRDERVRCVLTRGVGGGGARNVAINHAAGAYLAFLDDDDEYTQEKLSRQIEFMLENDLDMSYQDVEWYDEGGKLVEHRRLDYAASFDSEELLRQHILHSLCPTSVYMIRTDCFFKTKGFAEVSQGQDWHFMLSCIESGLRIGYMPGAYVKQYLHAGERISTGASKIEGENKLYEVKKRYFHLLNAKERRYVVFRHYAVLAFACKRTGWYGMAFAYAMRTIAASPLYCLAEARRYFGGVAANAV